ncbi:MAG TPA: hypothetical protein VFY29_21015 [Terriglobia bacterium]|nr:hypothetical protein [Terriglobia bacterium]
MMAFNVGDVVRICEDDLLRAGECARVFTVRNSNCQSLPIREYVVEFASPPKTFPNDDRFLFCAYREEQLIRWEGRRNAES